MCKTSIFFIHFIGISALVGLSTYVYLNETGNLNKVKRKCFSKMMDIKDDFKKSLK